MRQRRGRLVLVLWLLALLRRARRTRPEPLPPAPAGSDTVLADDGTRLHAQVGGRLDADLTVVLVHGFLARTLEFDMQWQHLGRQVRLVRYDHRNHGRSERSRRPVDVGTLADDLAAVLRQLVPTDAVLVGHSMGGMTVLALAERHQDLFRERVRGVALLSSAAGHDLPGHPVENATRWLARRRVLAPTLALLRLVAPVVELLRPRRTDLVRRGVAGLMFGTADVDPATLSQTQELLEEPPLSTTASLQGALLRHDVRRALPLLADLPVLVLTGADDRLVRPGHSVRMAEDLGPQAELVVVPGAGHVVNQTRPTETNAALDRLLARAARG